MQTCPTLERLVLELHKVRENLNKTHTNLRYARKRIALLEQERLKLAHALLMKDTEIIKLQRERNER